MKVNRSVEHGVLVLLMLALQRNHEPVTSQVLAARMGVSDSYLKKTLRKLVVAGLVESSATRGGGFCLARPIDQITLADAYEALEGEGFSFRASPQDAALFPDTEHTAHSIETITDVFEQGYQAFLERLSTCRLSSLLKDDVWQQGDLDWSAPAGDGAGEAVCRAVPSQSSIV